MLIANSLYLRLNDARYVRDCRKCFYLFMMMSFGGYKRVLAATGFTPADDSAMQRALWLQNRVEFCSPASDLPFKERASLAVGVSSHPRAVRGIR
jgi:hypothetical protein